VNCGIVGESVAGTSGRPAGWPAGRKRQSRRVLVGAARGLAGRRDSAGPTRTRRADPCQPGGGVAARRVRL